VNADLLQGFYLRDLLVDPVKGNVTGRDGSVHLPPKAMEALLVLASNHGSLVTREELIDEVWGKDHGSQEALSHAISEIRHALDDHADNPNYIQTLPKRGYRLIIRAQPASVHTASVVLGAGNGAGVANSGLFANLNQRGVLETAIAYLLLGWLLIQIADIVFSQLMLPAWTGTFVTVLVIAGFPIAILLSWFLEFRDGRAIPQHDLSPRDSVNRRFSRTYISVISALAIASVFVFIYDKSVGLPQAPADTSFEVSANLPPIQKNSIAVLRLLALDPSEGTRILANGLADDVITRLSRVPGLLVASRGDSFTLEPNTPSERVRERLRVANYVEGSVQIEGDQLRVVVQLIDSKTGFHVLSRSFNRPLDNYFDMRDEITELTVASLRPALPPATRATSTSAMADPTIDIWLMYRRGIDASRQPDIEGSIDEALEWFDKALAIDPEYAAALAGKCDVHVEGYVWTNDSTHIDAAESACAMALNLNPNLDVVYTSLGDLYTATGRYELAREAYLDALNIHSESAPALIGLGEVYRQLQLPEKAEASIQQAAGLHPGDWAAYNALGTFYFRSGRYAEAAEQYRNVLALDNSNIRGHTNLASALMLAEEFEAAEPVFRRALELEAHALTYSNFGMLLYNLGRFDESVEAHRSAVEMEPMDYLVRSNLADALWAAGNRAKAIEVFSVANDLALDALRVNRNDAFILMDLAWIKMALGEHAKARELIDDALDKVPDDPYVHYIEALIHNRRGDTRSTLEALETAVELGYSTELLARDPNLSNLHQNSSFNSLLIPTN
jgi:tetratricopeptide (TPR) repeat protein